MFEQKFPFVSPPQILHVMSLPPIHVTFPPVCPTHSVTARKTVGRCAHSASLRWYKQPNKLFFGRRQRPDRKVLHFHLYSPLSARQRFIEFCRNARFKTYVMNECACFDRVKHNHHQAACFGSACRRKTYSCSHTWGNKNGGRNVVLT